MNWLTVSIPAYNEENNITQLIQDIINVCDSNYLDFKILIINDGSVDKTSEIILENFGNNSRISLINHNVNLGFGPTINECFSLPDSEWIMNISGDHQFPAENISRMIKYTNTHDIILGYRFNRNDNLYRRITSRIYNLVISVLAGRKINDVSSILLVKKSLICDVPFKSKSGFIHAEIALSALKKSSSLVEVELVHKERLFGKSSGGKPGTIFYTIYEMLKYIIGVL